MVKSAKKNTKKNVITNFGKFIISFGLYKGKRIHTLPIDYLHWLIYTKDQTTDWIKVNHNECFKAAEQYFINYENKHSEGDFTLYFGRNKGKKLSDVPSRYLAWLSRKGDKESISWVRENHPDAVVNAQKYLKNNSLCFKCGKKVEEPLKNRLRSRVKLAKKVRKVKGKKIHKSCIELEKSKEIKINLSQKNEILSR